MTAEMFGSAEDLGAEGATKGLGPSASPFLGTCNRSYVDARQCSRRHLRVGARVGARWHSAVQLGVVSLDSVDRRWFGEKCDGAASGSRTRAALR